MAVERSFEERCLELFERHPPKLQHRNDIKPLQQFRNGCVSACLSAITGIPHKEIFHLVHPEYFEKRRGVHALFEFFRCTDFDFEVPFNELEHEDDCGERVILRVLPSLNYPNESHMVVFFPVYTTITLDAGEQVVFPKVFDPQKFIEGKRYYGHKMQIEYTDERVVEIHSAEWYHDQIIIYR